MTSIFGATAPSPIDILLIEDNPADAELTREALRGGKIQSNLHVIEDGDAAFAYLRRQGDDVSARHPDLVLLDLNLPGRDGLSVLEEIKSDPELCHIPVVILTTSEAEQDVMQSHRRHANCYVTKPVNLQQFRNAVRTIEHFWCAVVRLPSAGRAR